MPNKKPKMFTCPKMPKGLKTKLTVKSCAKRYKLANAERTLPNLATSSIYRYCKTCERGLQNFKKQGYAVKQRKIENKVCKVYQYAPDLCKNESVGGIFYKTQTMNHQTWQNKRYCSPVCGVRFNHLRKQGLVK